MQYNGHMKTNGVHNIMRPSDVREYPMFYMELAYAFWTLAGLTNGGVGLLLLFSLVAVGIGFYGLFRGGFKWRARHMFLQFIIRLYVVIGSLSIYGIWPTSWIANALGATVASILYLRLRWEAAKRDV
jgi:hypothetical protein